MSAVVDMPLEEVVGHFLREQGLTLAVAESCTGGLISHRLTNVSGSSGYCMGGEVTYSNQAKMDLLMVPEDILATRGAVSSETARAMAVGVAEIFHADIGLTRPGYPHRSAGLDRVGGPAGGRIAPGGVVKLDL